MILKSTFNLIFLKILEICEIFENSFKNLKNHLKYYKITYVVFYEKKKPFINGFLKNTST